MRILIVGAGVLGSLYAERLSRSGENVTVLARGNRYQQMKEHGIVIKDFYTGEKRVQRVNVIKESEVETNYDLVIIFVQFSQINGVLSILDKITETKTFLFMGNNPKGSGYLEERLGVGKVMMGFPGAGGTIQEYTVIYADRGDLDDEVWGIYIGEPDGSETPRMIEIKHIFEEAGVPVEFSDDINAYLLCHGAMIFPVAMAMRKTDYDIDKVAQDKELVKTTINAVKESLKAISKLGIDIQPSNLKLMLAVPTGLIWKKYKHLMESDFAQIGLQGHAAKAQQEMNAISDQILTIINKAEMKAASVQELIQYK